ncbi:unnamed protein product [Cylindrotheca closterium]|uniref:Uncharacterized protein n=1 Tax=Cylindrotheca closterium TaxID=2856 RepID=A0AAD2CB97_9STRA|nr:unnamed protein product [Cylindrotheca closterium]
MAPITSEGNKDFEKLVLIAQGNKALSAHTVLSKYDIQSEDDFTNALSSLVPHPIALAFQSNRRNTEGPECNQHVRFRLWMCRFIRDYAKIMLLDSVGILHTKIEMDKLVGKRKSQRQLNRFWSSHADTCILCDRGVMKKYGASFGWKKCTECKGWVCPYCDCQNYHLFHQAKLLGVSLETGKCKPQYKKIADMRTGKPNKERQVAPISTMTKHLSPAQVAQEIKKTLSPCSVISASSNDRQTPHLEARQDATIEQDCTSVKRNEPFEERVNFVQYLQETNSMIALANLMDGLELQGYDFERESFNCTFVDIE